MLSEMIQAEKGKCCVICLHAESTTLISQTLNLERNSPEAGVSRRAAGMGKSMDIGLQLFRTT